MLKKIEPKLLKTVNVLDRDYEIECLIKVQSTRHFKYICNSDFCTDIIKLPFINTVAVKIKKDKVYKIAKLNFVKYISSNSKVFTQINNARKVLGVEKIIPRNLTDFSCAVIDTGLYPHLDFSLTSDRILAFKDFINNKTQMYDDNGHGTTVTGALAGGGVVSCGKYSGVDKNLKLVVIKALCAEGEGRVVTILKSMQWILDNQKKYNIKIVCISFGSNVQELNDPLIMAAEVLWNNGITVVSACGNTGPTAKTIQSPSASSKIISVGALDDGRGESSRPNIDKFSVADFSSRGPILNVFKPDVLASGVNITTTSNYAINKKFYTTTSGTSLAAPIVAGVCSLLLRKHPTLTPNEIKKLLIQNCHPITGDRNAEGYGWLDVTELFEI